MDAPAKPVAFAALRMPAFRLFVSTFMLTMMADNIEHVISYWVAFQKFHSSALGGFAVISHWLPYLLFSVPVGALNDRYDSRRLIQLGAVIFAFVSLGWGYFFLTDTLQIWHAMVLLVLHGCAGVFWGTSSQMLLYDIVGPELIQSAVRINATARYLGVLVGPAVGSLLLRTLGPTKGIFVNAAFYLPLFLWLVRAPYGRHYRDAHAAPHGSRSGAAPSPDARSAAAPHGSPSGSAPRPDARSAAAPRGVKGIADIVQTIRDVRGMPVLTSLILLAGAASFFVGNSYQAQMPGFATDLGNADPGIAYTALLGADAAGALTGGLLLESGRKLFATKPSSALVLAMLWGAALGAFGLTRSYPVAIALLAAAGFCELSFSSMTQTIVQMQAPDAIRGRVLGLFSMSSSGLRTFSGITVGLVGSAMTIHTSLALASTLFVAIAFLLWMRVRRA